MKIMIPASGGLDSTLLLYETLRDTDHEVVAVHYAEDYINTVNPTLQRKAFDAVTGWLKANVRDFQTVQGVVKYGRASGLPYDQQARLQYLPKGQESGKTFWFRCRYSSHGCNAAALGVDEVWLALTVFNLAFLHYPAWTALAMSDYSSYADVPLRTPWAARQNSGNVLGRGRLENMRRIPQAIAKAVAVDSLWGDMPSMLDLFYQEFCDQASDDDVQQIQERSERLGQYGRYFSLAKTATYRHSGHKAVFADLEGWREWDRAGRPRDG